MEHGFEVSHVTLEIKVDFDRFTRTLEQSLGRFDNALLEGLETDPAKVEARLQTAAGKEEMMLFGILDHGALLNIFGSPKKAKQYVLGNPLIATQMTRHDIRAGLYAPLRLLVYEAEVGLTRIEYDKPSSLFGQFDTPEITAVAQSLDAKLAGIIKTAERLAAKHL